MDLFEIAGIEVEKEWEKEWHDMPEWRRDDKRPFQKIVVNFKSYEDVLAFAELIGQKLTKRTDTIWFPPNKTPTGVFVHDEQE